MTWLRPRQACAIVPPRGAPMLNLNLRRSAGLLAVALILNLCPTSARAHSARDNSVNTSYNFLNSMMDAYASGNTVRLVQSYSDQLFAPFSAVAFTYDNAVAIQAYLASGCSADLQRATVLGNGLIHAQATNFPFNDGRFAQAYYVNVPDSSGAYITPAAFPFYFYTSAVGDQAWAGMALAQLYARTGNAAYLTAALNVANWIVNTPTARWARAVTAMERISISSTNPFPRAMVSRLSTTSTPTPSSLCWQNSLETAAPSTDQAGPHSRATR